LALGLSVAMPKVNGARIDDIQDAIAVLILIAATHQRSYATGSRHPGCRGAQDAQAAGCMPRLISWAML
jgi:hypothetical protein